MFTNRPTRSLQPLQTITFLAAALIATSASARPATEVTECGQEVRRGRAVLNADLDCSAYEGSALRLHRARLHMNGFTITGNPDYRDPENPENGVSAVLCEKACRIFGPGTITGASGGDLGGTRCCTGEALNGKRVLVDGITIEGNGGSGVGARKLVLRNCTIQNNAANGVWHSGNTKIFDSVIENNAGRGVVQPLFGGGRLAIRRSRIAGNHDQGIASVDPTWLSSVEITDNGSGQDTCGFSYIPDTFPCVDLYVIEAPHARNLTCGTSYNRDTRSPTGLCSQD